MVNATRRRVSRRAVQGFVRDVARLLPPPEDAGTLGVALVADTRMREWNRAYREKDRTTDVLAFPGGGDPPLRRQRPHLGDIAISLPQAERQAREAGHSLGREIRILLLHGYLHLLGHDHERDGGAMMRLQARLERRLLGRGSAR